ncbi:MAG: hypothetical protein E7166_00680 [Firmicutes bacterium]|nr:hypothetical protein [Bacillota bacterium]
MEMISPEIFKENNTNKTYDELLEIKENIKNKIEIHEKLLNDISSSIFSEEDLKLMIDMNKSYLIEIDKLINSLK